jgi:glycine betaine/proline transport system ATP-binding protein
VQAGTPEEIVLNPATAYVREFTRAVPRSKVVRVARVMGAVEGPAPSGSVPARATVAEAAPLFLDGAAALRVLGDDGATVGHLHRDAVVVLMLGG